MSDAKFEITFDEKFNYKLLKNNLYKYFHHQNFKSTEQQDATQTILKCKQDVFISMPTGSGKSLCFQLPGIMQENKITIVFSPLLTLMKDPMNHLKKNKICCESINAKMSAKDRDRVLNDLKSKKPETRFLYVTPDQAVTESFKNIVKSMHKYDKLAYFVVEKAHCVSHWGHDFRNDYLKLYSLRSAYPSIPWIALTGAVSKDVVADIIKHLQLRKPIATFKIPCFRKNLYYDVYYCDDIFKRSIADKFIHLKEYISKCLGSVDHYVKNNNKPSGIIYCGTNEIVEQVAKGLTKHGVNTMSYHEGLSILNRTKIQEDWMAGLFPVIVATINFGIEIDKSSVRLVLHWNVPQSVASYYQESDRVGRYGLSSVCRIYYCKEDVKMIDLNLKKEIATSKDHNLEKAKRAHAEFLKMCDFCETITCRHKLFSEYFGDEPPECNNRCDVCRNPKQVKLALDNFNRHSEDLFSGPKRIDRAESHCAGEGTSQNKGDIKKPSDKVKFAESTAFIVDGLTNTIREKYLSTIVDKLKENYMICTPKDGSFEVFQYRDFEECGKIIEYHCVSKSNEFSMYHRCMTHEINKLNKLSSNRKLSPTLKNYVPIKDLTVGANSIDIGMKMMQNLKSIVEQNTMKNIKSKSRGIKVDPLKQTLIGVFLRSHHETSPLKAERAITTKDILPVPHNFHRENNQVETTTASSVLSSTQIRIKDEFQSPQHWTTMENIDITSGTFNDRCVKSEPSSIEYEMHHHTSYASSELFRMKTQPQGNISPANTIIKEEVDESTSDPPNRGEYSNISNELFEMKTRTPRDLSSVSNEKLDDESNPAFTGSDDNTLVRNLVMPRHLHYVSSAETIIKEESEPFQSNETIIIKREPISPKESTCRKEPIHSSVKREVSPSNVSSSNYSSTSTSSNFGRQRQHTSSVSPTDTIIKCEQASPKSVTNSTDHDFENKHTSRHLSKKHRRSEEHSNKRKKSRESNYDRKQEASSSRDGSHKYTKSSKKDKRQRMSSDDSNDRENPLRRRRESEKQTRHESEHDSGKRDKIKRKSNLNFEGIISNDTNHSHQPKTSKDQCNDAANRSRRYSEVSSDNSDDWDGDSAVGNLKMDNKSSESLLPTDATIIEKSTMKNVINTMRQTPTQDRKELMFHGQIKQIETEFQGQKLPAHLLTSIKQEKCIIAALVKKHLMPYYNEGRIQPKDWFSVVARTISHVFYDRSADETIIQGYVNDLFQKVGIVTKSTNLITDYAEL